MPPVLKSLLILFASVLSIAAAEPSPTPSSKPFSLPSPEASPMVLDLGEVFFHDKTDKPDASVPAHKHAWPPSVNAYYISGQLRLTTPFNDAGAPISSFDYFLTTGPGRFVIDFQVRKIAGLDTSYAGFVVSASSDPAKSLLVQWNGIGEYEILKRGGEKPLLLAHGQDPRKIHTGNARNAVRFIREARWVQLEMNGTVVCSFPVEPAARSWIGLEMESGMQLSVSEIKATALKDGK